MFINDYLFMCYSPFIKYYVVRVVNFVCCIVDKLESFVIGVRLRKVQVSKCVESFMHWFSRMWTWALQLNIYIELEDFGFVATSSFFQGHVRKGLGGQGMAVYLRALYQKELGRQVSVSMAHTLSTSI